MIYIGLDVHKKKTKVAMLDSDSGELHKPYDVPTTQLAEHLARVDGHKQIAMETSTTAQFVAAEIESCGLEVMVVDAHKSHRLLQALAKSKTDKLDAIGLAILLAKGMLDSAQIWVPDQKVRELRDLTRTRDALVKKTTSVRNTIRKLLCRAGLDCPHSDLSGQAATQWLDENAAALSPGSALALCSLRQTLAFLADQVQKLTELLEQQAQTNETIALLETIPGIGPLLAAIIAAEIGDISRFENACKLRGYTGLVPRVNQSGERYHTGPLVRHGNRLLRWALVQAAQHFAHTQHVADLRITGKYRQHVFAHGPNPAKVALARRLSDIIYAMLRDRTKFNPDLLVSDGIG